MFTGSDWLEANKENTDTETNRETGRQTVPAAAMCSLVLIGWKPTKGICMDRISPIM